VDLLVLPGLEVRDPASDHIAYFVDGRVVFFLLAFEKVSVVMVYDAG
jgi:hypothetical protein